MSNPTDPTRGQKPGLRSPAQVDPGARAGNPERGVMLVSGAGFALAIVGLVVSLSVGTGTSDADSAAGPATATESPAPAAVSPAPATTVPLEQYLADLPPTGSTAYTGAITVDSVSYQHAIYQQFSGCATEVRHTYDLNGEWSSFSSMIGVADGGNTASVLRFDVAADGRSLFTSGNIGVGKPPEIDVPVAGVQSLTIGFTMVDGNMGSCTQQGNGVWGDPTLTK